MFNEQHHRMHRKKKLFLIPVFALLFFGLTAAVQYLWNYALPGATHAAPLTYWQAAALLVLCKILLGNFHFGRRGPGGPGFGRHGGMPFGWQKHEMRERWMGMSDEERAKFKERFKDRCKGWRG